MFILFVESKGTNLVYFSAVRCYHIINHSDRISSETTVFSATARRAYVTERARESDSLLVRTDRPGLSMQYKLIATTDASLSDAEKHLRTVYSVLIIKTEQDLFGITDETVFIYDVARNRDVADRLLALLAGGCVSPANAKDVIDDLLCE